MYKKNPFIEKYDINFYIDRYIQQNLTDKEKSLIRNFPQLNRIIIDKFSSPLAEQFNSIQSKDIDKFGKTKFIERGERVVLKNGQTTLETDVSLEYIPLFELESKIDPITILKLDRIFNKMNERGVTSDLRNALRKQAQNLFFSHMKRLDPLFTIDHELKTGMQKIRRLIKEKGMDAKETEIMGEKWDKLTYKRAELIKQREQEIQVSDLMRPMRREQERANPSHDWIQETSEEIEEEGTSGTFTAYCKSKFGATTVKERERCANTIIREYANWKDNGELGRSPYTLKTYRRAVYYNNLKKARQKKNPNQLKLDIFKKKKIINPSATKVEDLIESLIYRVKEGDLSPKEQGLYETFKPYFLEHETLILKKIYNILKKKLKPKPADTEEKLSRKELKKQIGNSVRKYKKELNLKFFKKSGSGYVFAFTDVPRYGGTVIFRPLDEIVVISDKFNVYDSETVPMTFNLKKDTDTIVNFIKEYRKVLKGEEEEEESPVSHIKTIEQAKDYFYQKAIDNWSQGINTPIAQQSDLRDITSKFPNSFLELSSEYDRGQREQNKKESKELFKKFDEEDKKEVPPHVLKREEKVKDYYTNNKPFYLLVATDLDQLERDYREKDYKDPINFLNDNRAKFKILKIDTTSSTKFPYGKVRAERLSHGDIGDKTNMSLVAVYDYINLAEKFIERNEDQLPSSQDEIVEEVKEIEDYGKYGNRLDYQRIRDSYRNLVWNPEDRAKEYIKDAQDYLTTLETAARKLAEDNDIPFEEIEDLWNSLVDRYFVLSNEFINRQSRTISVMITGRGGINADRENKRTESREKKRKELVEFTGDILRRILKRINKLVTVKKGGEYAQKKEELEEMIKQHAYMIQANKIYRSKKLKDDEKIKKLMEIGNTEGGAKKILDADFEPFASYQIKNSNARIKAKKNTVARLEKIEKAKSSDIQTEFDYDDMTVTYNLEDDRIEIISKGGKPSREVINKYKDAGLKWNRKKQVWQRKISRNSVYTLNRVLGLNLPNLPS